MADPSGGATTRLADQLFALNVGILFSAFSAVAMWAQGVPRQLAALAGLVAGLVWLALSVLTYFLVKSSGPDRHRIWAFTTAFAWATALVLSWRAHDAPWHPDTLVSQTWVYTHPRQSLAAGIVWLAAAGLWLLLLRSLISRPGQPSVMLRLAIIVGSIGVIAKVLAAVLLGAAPIWWPDRSADRFIDWYRWLNFGVADLGIALAGLGINLFLPRDLGYPSRARVFGILGYGVGCIVALLAVGMTTPWYPLWSHVVALLIVAWLLLLLPK